MSSNGPLRVEVEDGRGTRELDPESFPLAIGGESSAVELPLDESEEPAAWLGIADGDVFVQAAENGREIVLNGRRLSSSEWLQHGDVLRIGESLLEVGRADGRLTLSVRLAGSGGAAPRLTPPVGPPPRLPVPVARDGAAPARPAAAGRAVIEAVEFRPRDARRRERAARTGRRLRRGVVGAVLLSATLVAWWILTARSIAIEIDPVPDRLAIEGEGFSLRLAGRFVLRPGSYRIVAEKEGYRSLELPIEVGKDQPDAFELELEPLPGLVTVDVGGVAGATVRVDGEEVGVTPLEPLELAAGTYRIEVEATGHFVWETDLEVTGFGARQTVTAELDSRIGLVVVDSEPRGATVTIDGREVGATPLEVPVLSGAHRIELRRSGYLPARRRLDVEAEKSHTLPLVTLSPAPGSLEVVSVPPGATVTADGRYEGETPITIELPPGETTRLALTLADHLPVERTVELERGETRRLEVTLEAQRGELIVAVVPESAVLFVDGEERGAANQTLELSAGREHRVEIRLEGFETHSQTVVTRPDFAQRIEVRLRSVEEAKAAAVVPVLTTSQGQEMRLVEGGSFQMGASRREPGRRANEALRDVTLVRRFYLATEEVSNAEFREFRTGHRSGAVSSHSLEVDTYPVVQVTWEDAALYCNWLSEKEGLDPVYESRDGVLVSKSPVPNGYRLPTEAEWAWVARYGGRAGEGRKYPWGSSLPVPARSENYGDRSASSFLATTLDGYDDGSAAAAPVDAFGPDEQGFYSLGGNVAEWMHDLYSLHPPSIGAAAIDPTGPKEGELHVIRGASWRHATITELRLSFRDYGKEARSDLGFRIARYLE